MRRPHGHEQTKKEYKTRIFLLLVLLKGVPPKKQVEPKLDSRWAVFFSAIN